MGSSSQGCRSRSSSSGNSSASSAAGAALAPKLGLGLRLRLAIELTRKMELRIASERELGLEHKSADAETEAEETAPASKQGLRDALTLTARRWLDGAMIAESSLKAAPLERRPHPRPGPRHRPLPEEDILQRERKGQAP
jgi:hypothetical protein